MSTFSVEQNDKNIDAEPTLTTLRTNLSSKSLSNGTDKNWKYWCIMRYMNHSFFRHVTIILIYLSRNRSWEKHVSHNYNTLPHHPRWLVWSNRTRMTHSLQHTHTTHQNISQQLQQNITDLTKTATHFNHKHNHISWFSVKQTTYNITTCKEYSERIALQTRLLQHKIM